MKQYAAETPEPQSDKLEKPDIEFQYKNATYILDVTFAVEANICNAFNGKIHKYGGTYGYNRVIPLVLRYNGTDKLPEDGHRERRQSSRVWEQGKAKGNSGSEQPLYLPLTVPLKTHGT
ncbi:Hypothetical_protein [Hexamita inflata]|uniref:Hypothetical_protein n=1 Tax=Hexamita inflata TaxID=28002 RepID=A0ABP1LNT7_9EUKA